MLITKVEGKVLTVALYDRDTNKLVEWGQIRVKDTEGWTLSNFDWSDFIAQRE
jgi:hypothetical protein